MNKTATKTPQALTALPSVIEKHLRQKDCFEKLPSVDDIPILIEECDNTWNAPGETEKTPRTSFTFR